MREKIGIVIAYYICQRDTTYHILGGNNYEDWHFKRD